GKQQLECAGLGHEASAGREHATRVRVKCRLEGGALHAAKRFLPEHLEYLAQAHAALAFDLAIELDEGNSALGGDKPADGRLAAAAQPDQRDPVLPRRARRAELGEQKLARRREL